MLKNYISLAKAYPLTNIDVLNVSGLDVIPYNELSKFSSLEDIFYNYDGKGSNRDGVIILYLSSETSGHYCLMYTNQKEDTIYFYDSYGLNIDHQMLINRWYTHNGGVPILSLLPFSSSKLIVNKYIQQDASFDSEVCGSYCILRYQTRHIYTMEQFNKLLTEGARRIRSNKDDFLSLITMSGIYLKVL